MPLAPWLSHYKTDFELARRRRNESIAFDDMRCEAFDRFLRLGFPSTADATWRLTDITALAETNFSLGAKPAEGAASDALTALPFGALSELEITFINGYCIAGGSRTAPLPGGAVVAPLMAVLTSSADDVRDCFARIARVDCLPFVALNTALFEDGAAVIVPPGTAIEQPIHARFLSNGEADAKPAMSQPRMLLVLCDGSRATVVESYAGPDGIDYFTNGVTEVVLGEGAALDHYRLQRESTAAYHISATHVMAGRNSTYSGHAITLGGALVRNETMILLGGDGARCAVNGLYVADGKRLVDTCTMIDHAMPDCASRQRYRGIVGVAGRGVFSGRNTVRPGAEKTASVSIRTHQLAIDRIDRFVAFSRPTLNRIARPLRAAVKRQIQQRLKMW
jgi:Fe-S cluster assembly protein SufD